MGFRSGLGYYCYLLILEDVEREGKVDDGLTLRHLLKVEYHWALANEYYLFDLVITTAS